jgi:hypothetical protein
MQHRRWQQLSVGAVAIASAWRGLVTVAIADCVHFCGCRFGRDERNPYEKYVLDLSRGVDVWKARQHFVDFLRHYRPRHFGQALGCDLSRQYPLWSYPWRRGLPQPAWRERADDCPDILTHFSEEGILSYRIDEEFVWLERALAQMRREGYRPDRYGYVVGIELRPAAGDSTFLLRDGNHRVAALSALGHGHVRMRRALRCAIVRETDIEWWPQVRSGLYTVEDARKVFGAYTHGNRRLRTTDESTRVIAPSGWERLYPNE